MRDTPSQLTVGVSVPAKSDGSQSDDANRASSRLSAMARTKPCRIASAPAQGLVALEGVVVPIGHATLVAPLSQAACVWWRVVIDQVRGSSRDTVLDVSDGRDFLVDDRTGALARVTWEEMTVPFATTEGDAAHAERVRRLLDARGINASTDGLVWFEQRIAPGEAVYVLGEAASAQRVLTGAYRPAVASNERLTVVAPAEGELLVSLGSAAELSRLFRRTRALIVAVWALALVMALLAFGGWLLLYGLKD